MRPQFERLVLLDHRTLGIGRVGRSIFVVLVVVRVVHVLGAFFFQREGVIVGGRTLHRMLFRYGGVVRADLLTLLQGYLLGVQGACNRRRFDHRPRSKKRRPIAGRRDRRVEIPRLRLHRLLDADGGDADRRRPINRTTELIDGAAALIKTRVKAEDVEVRRGGRRLRQKEGTRMVVVRQRLQAVHDHVDVSRLGGGATFRNSTIITRII